MILTATHIHRLVGELRETILGSRIKEVLRAVSERAAILQLQFQRRREFLLLSTHPEFCRVELLDKLEADYQTRPGQFACLRGGHLMEVSQIGFDRALEFSIERETEIGGLREYRLIAELTGPQANLILVEAETGKILQCLRLARPGKKRSRDIAPGKQYSPLPKVGRLSPLQLDPEGISTLLEREPRKSLKSLLTSNLWGVNDSIIEELATRCHLNPQARVGELTEEDWRNLSKAIGQLYALSTTKREAATVITDQRGIPEQLLFYRPREAPERSRKSFPALLEAINFFYRGFIKERVLQRHWSTLARRVEGRITKAERRKTELQQQLSESQRKGLYKIYGDLLMLQPDKKRRGQGEVIVDNIFEAPPKRLTIELDPKMSLLENARRYYKRLKKAVSGEKLIQAQLQKTTSDLAVLERARKKLGAEPSEAVILSLGAELAPLGIAPVSGEEEKGDKKTTRERQFRPREFVTSDGWRVLVGRSDRENDHLTFKLASKEDLWFHARGAHGSHVILKRPTRKSQPSRRAIEEAASVAAYFSKQRTSSKVSVSYTLVKHLRKPRKARPGLVLVQQEKSLIVEPRLLSRVALGTTTDE
jgi:predicted ribosome quality control (RQC) complex YloA/Tae2 family protein